MRRRTTIIVLSWLAVLLLLVAGPWSAHAQAPAPLIVIVSQDSPLKDVSSAELRKLFMRNTDRLDGEPAIPFNFPPHSPDRVKFDRTILRMSESEVGRYWIDRKVRGQSGPPRTADSPALLRRVIMKLKGSVTYIRADQIEPGVRALTIDGKAHTDPAYPLR